MYLIASLVDEVSFGEAGSGRRLVLVKRIETKGERVTMPEKKRRRDGEPGSTRRSPDLAELCRIHEIGLDLIGRSHDIDELLDRVLEEYETRLSALPSDALDARSDADIPRASASCGGS